MSSSDREFHLGPSWSHVCLSAALHSGAVLALWASGMNHGAAWLLTAVIVAGLAHDVRCTGLRRGPRAIRAFRFRDGRLTLFRNDGSRLGPAVVRSGWVLGAIVLLGVSVRPWHRAVVMVPSDALPPGSYRQLRIVVNGTLDAAEPV